jgi:hypothetical protein
VRWTSEIRDKGKLYSERIDGEKTCRMVIVLWFRRQEVDHLRKGVCCDHQSIVKTSLKHERTGTQEP